ncbi:hypothetical protein DV096_05460 [Bradymonadaceae bacterium TMQ3]|uniref:Uncharacterized protein n=1 Tax=Lujinxingia sediminis TaxID=2480984 RepID=A0ABY0CVQ3_9DELT|nr:hypothetical protein [Lujinxingia sediminis]RDV40005.1 hypothetical protein DV096_05460 [Bradymonadaceae bacterium TMQ3]RVU47948.1 hypothetical protein EA187_00490 [Lujinxingia sediminis]TXC77249.1 hypothetical protein FRC91_00485 [Bradymonadales bacterium TMQ1]
MGDQEIGLRMIWALEREPLSDAEGARELWAGALQACGDEAVDYDLNQRGQWRAFDADRLIVDTLTQRTQVVMVRLSQGGMIALSTGKHGERPRLVAELRLRLEEHVERLDAMTAVGIALMRSLLIFARIDRSDRAQPGASNCVSMAASGEPPQRLTSLLTSIEGVELTSTPSGWQARARSEAVGDSAGPEWQSFCDTLSAEVLT